ncbi:MAG TPA: nucleotidyltransferase family protein [Solirubrobacterales bacterium]|nr:nucleotidyltransferase family protein [Solirubrobacterales bacterium]
MIRKGIELGPEQEMALLAAGTETRRHANGARLESLADQVDWSLLANLLARARLLPTLGPRILEIAGEKASAGFEQDVAASVEAVSRQDALFMLICGRLMETLGAAGIRAALLKGPALGEELYGEPGRRTSSDIDLLVPVERLEEAVRLVGDLGYAAPTDPLELNGRPLLHFAMLHEHGEMPAVELHWRIHWYEDSFARERLLPPTPQGLDWRPQPVDQLASLLLYYARDGLGSLRQATDLGAWWDRFGDDLPPGGLETLVETYPELGPAVAAAARVAERTIGLPAERVLRRNGRLGPRGRLAVRLADPRPYVTPQQFYAEIGLIDGLLTPRRGLRAFVRRQVAPSHEVIREHVERAQGAHVTTRAGYAARVLGRYAIAFGRLLRVPGASRLRFGPSPAS